MDSDSKVLVAGANGMVGSAIVRNLESKGYTNIIKGTREDVDFTNQDETERYFRLKEPEYVYLAAAKVGGIGANNDYPAHFIYDNLMIQSNIIHASCKFGVKKLLFLGSSCIYPKMCEQPIKEEYLMTGRLEPTNDAYAVAKIAGIKMCQAYRQQYGFNAISLMPTNLYGPNDNFDNESSHVISAMIGKFDSAMRNKKSAVLWGDGSVKREFLHVDDLAEACFICMKSYNDLAPINVGTGEDITIKELSIIISNIVKFTGSVDWDTSKPNGTPRKLLNVEKIKSLGWIPEINLYDGIQSTYDWYVQEIK